MIVNHALTALSPGFHDLYARVGRPSIAPEQGRDGLEGLGSPQKWASGAGFPILVARARRSRVTEADAVFELARHTQLPGAAPGSVHIGALGEDRARLRSRLQDALDQAP